MAEAAMLHVLPAGSGAALALIAVLAAVTWVVSVLRTDASLADRTWPLFFLAATGAWLQAHGADRPRAGLAAALVAAWGVRLFAYIPRRNAGHGEDRRYQAMRERNSPGFAWKSLYLVFGLQGALAWVIAWPVGVAIAAPRPFGALDLAGAALAAFGIVFEAVADAQMAAFRARAGQAGRVMDRGLWRYSRHPNYFGEACTWWGLALLALSGAGWAGAWVLASPLLVTVLLLRVSGVALLEKDIDERRPEYRRYKETTPAFVPGRPRRSPRSPAPPATSSR